MSILEISGLYKNFGQNKVVQNLNLSVPEHTIFGFVGQNGAGKTTTMKMVLGLLKPTKGEIKVCGEKVSYGETKTNKKIGYLPDVPEFYGYMRPKEYLNLCGEITGLSKSETKKRSEELLKLVGLSEVNRKIAGFSRGMKQRLGIAQALLNKPTLLICDEPTSALDPMGRKEILDILYTVKKETTVIFSTHILSDVERICDHVAILHEGNIKMEGTLSDIKNAHKHNSFLIEFGHMNQCEKFMDLLKAESDHLSWDQKGIAITVHVKELEKEGQKLLALLEKNGITPWKFEVVEPNLESLFLEVVK